MLLGVLQKSLVFVACCVSSGLCDDHSLRGVLLGVWYKSLNNEARPRHDFGRCAIPKLCTIHHSWNTVPFGATNVQLLKAYNTPRNKNRSSNLEKLASATLMDNKLCTIFNELLRIFPCRAERFYFLNHYVNVMVKKEMVLCFAAWYAAKHRTHTRSRALSATYPHTIRHAATTPY